MQWMPFTASRAGKQVVAKRKWPEKIPQTRYVEIASVVKGRSMINKFCADDENLWYKEYRPECVPQQQQAKFAMRYKTRRCEPQLVKKNTR